MLIYSRLCMYYYMYMRFYMFSKHYPQMTIHIGIYKVMSVLCVCIPMHTPMFTFIYVKLYTVGQTHICMYMCTYMKHICIAYTHIHLIISFAYILCVCVIVVLNLYNAHIIYISIMNILILLNHIYYLLYTVLFDKSDSPKCSLLR